MNLYDSIIRKTITELAGQTPKQYAYDEHASWTDTGSNELIMLRDAAFELGGDGKPSVNYTCVTSDAGLVDKDEVLVYGPELNEIHGDESFARIVFLEVGDIGEDEEAYNAIRNMEFVRYHVFPKGYMSRVSSESNQEQVRISRNAIQQGISFEKVGDDYIGRYKSIAGVSHVKIIFLVGQQAIETLQPNAKKVDDITKTLTHILDGISTDCAHCNNKPICDEVEGLRELHLGKKKKS